MYPSIGRWRKKVMVNLPSEGKEVERERERETAGSDDDDDDDVVE